MNALPLLRNIVLAQKETPGLVPYPASLQTQTEHEINTLREQWRAGDEEALDRHEAIVNTLDDIQELRAQIVWEMAYSQTPSTREMTESEKQIFEQLLPLAAKLRGVE